MHRMRRTSVWLVVFLTASYATARPAPNDAYAIFERARTYWNAASYPATIAYDVSVTVSHNSIVSAAHYHAYYDAAAAKISSPSVSDEERAHPYVPHGINTTINLFGGSIPVSAPEHTFDYLGVPLLSPNYSFGVATVARHVTQTDSAELVREIRAEFHDPAQPRRASTQENGLKTIVSVEATHRHYIITLAGITSLGGHDDYHLRLTPIGDPSVYRLREAWIDAATFATDQVVTQGNFMAPQLQAVRWLVTFTQIHGAPYLHAEIAQSGFMLDRRQYDSAKIEFMNIHKSSLPPYASLSMFKTRSGTTPQVLSEPDEYVDGQ